MADITRDDVLKLAKLARIDLTDEEVGQFAKEFDAIVGYVKQLQSVDIEGLDPTYQVTGLSNVTRPDEVRAYGYEPKQLLANAPQVDNGQLKVKRMVG